MKNELEEDAEEQDTRPKTIDWEHYLPKKADVPKNKFVMFLADSIQNPLSCLSNGFENQCKAMQKWFGDKLLGCYDQHEVGDFIKDVRTKRPGMVFIDYGGLSGHQNEFFDRISDAIQELVDEYQNTKFVILCTMSKEWHINHFGYDFVNSHNNVIFLENEFGQISNFFEKVCGIAIKEYMEGRIIWDNQAERYKEINGIFEDD